MEPSKDDIRQRTEALMNQGYQHLEQAEYDEALDVANQLEELQFTGAFEIAAFAHEGMGDIDEAVRVLHHGTEVAPDCWPNWELLGKYLCDQGRYEEAEAAYEQALECDDPWTASIRLNQAILAEQQERPEKALEFLEEVDDVRLKFEAAECRIASLRQLQQVDEARALAEDTLADDQHEEPDVGTLARIAAHLGQIRLAAGEDKGELREIALRWLDADPCSEAIFDLIRNVDGKLSEKPRFYRLLLHAEIPAGLPLSAEGHGYFVSYDIVAESVDEALEFVREFEDPQTVAGLEIEEIEEVKLDVEAESGEPKGVCSRSPMHFYGDEV